MKANITYRILRIFTWILTGILCVSTILGFLGFTGWILELFSHFRMQYLILLVACSFLFIVINSIKAALLALVFALVNFWEIKPYFAYKEPKEGQIKIAAINLLSINENTETVIDFIKSEDPDIFILQEFTERWEKELMSFISQYPYHYNINRNDNFGIALVSKSSPLDLQVYNFSTASVPSLLATYKFDGKELKIVATHPVPPASREKFNSRNEQLQGIMKLKSQLGKYYIVAGDLNITPYSYYFKNFTDQLDLKEAREGFGIVPTWPSCCWFIQLPIDHILTSQDIITNDFYTGPYIGSDHYSVIAKISLR